MSPSARSPVRPILPVPGRSRTARRRRRLLLAGAGAGVLVLGAALALPRLQELVPTPHRCTATAEGISSSLDPEQAGNAATIAALSVKRGLAARAATIGIATALQESKLVNLDHGDRDSVGLFQQRPSQGWGTPAQLQDPVYATNAFYDVLTRIEGYASLPVTDAAQQVQRSAFPAAYADHEQQARVFASALTGFSPAGLTCDLAPAAGSAQTAGPDGLTGRARRLVQAATRETGRHGTPVPSSAGRAVRFTVSGTDHQRLGWALASWAMARADGLQVTSVSVDGRTWTRGRSTGWAQPAGSARTGSTRTGSTSSEVLVRVA